MVLGQRIIEVRVSESVASYNLYNLVHWELATWKSESSGQKMLRPLIRASVDGSVSAATLWRSVLVSRGSRAMHVSNHVQLLDLLDDKQSLELPWATSAFWRSGSCWFTAGRVICGFSCSTTSLLTGFNGEAPGSLLAALWLTWLNPGARWRFQPDWGRKLLKLCHRHERLRVSKPHFSPACGWSVDCYRKVSVFWCSGYRPDPLIKDYKRSSQVS